MKTAMYELREILVDMMSTKPYDSDMQILLDNIDSWLIKDERRQIEQAFTQGVRRATVFNNIPYNLDEPSDYYRKTYTNDK